MRIVESISTIRSTYTMFAVRSRATPLHNTGSRVLISHFSRYQASQTAISNFRGIPIKFVESIVHPPIARRTHHIPRVAWNPSLPSSNVMHVMLASPSGAVGGGVVTDRVVCSVTVVVLSLTRATCAARRLPLLRGRRARRSDH